MNKFIFAVIVQCVFFSVTSCRNSSGPDPVFKDYRDFVVRHRDSAGLYQNKTWAQLDEEYNEKRWKAERRQPRWNDKTKAEFMDLQVDWESFREDFEAEKERRTNLEKSAHKVTTVLPPGIDESLSNVNTTNIVTVFRHFVSYVDYGRNDFVPQQWNQVEILWDRLSKRYDQLEHDLKGAEKAAISEQKIRYDVIKAINKPVARMDDH